MAGEQQRAHAVPADSFAKSPLSEALRAALADADEAGRYRMLAALLAELADASQSAGNGRRRVTPEEVESLSKRIQELTEEKATLLDKHATTRADLDRRKAQLEAEQTRAHELEQLMEQQRARLDALQKEFKTLEARLTAKDAEVHKAHQEIDRLTLQLQRAELSGGDQSKLERFEERGRTAAKELEALRSELKQLRTDKDAEIAKLSEQVAAGAAKPAVAEITLAEMWEQLASAKADLVEGHVPPNRQSAERLIGSFVELARFADDFDRAIRPFLSKYTRHHPPIKVPWDVFAKRDDAKVTLQQALAPAGGKPVGLVKNRLRGVYKWAEAAMIANDATVECIASELRSFVMGPAGAGSDPICTIKTFLKGDGDELFLQHMRELRALKLAEAFGRSG